MEFLFPKVEVVIVRLSLKYICFITAHLNIVDILDHLINSLCGTLPLFLKLKNVIIIQTSAQVHKDLAK